MQQCCWQGALVSSPKRDKSSHDPEGLSLAKLAWWSHQYLLGTGTCREQQSICSAWLEGTATSWSRFQVKPWHQIGTCLLIYKAQTSTENLPSWARKIFLVCDLQELPQSSEDLFRARLPSVKYFSMNWVICLMQSCIQCSPSSPSAVCSPLAVPWAPHREWALWEPGRGCCPWVRGGEWSFPFSIVQGNAGTILTWSFPKAVWITGFCYLIEIHLSFLKLCFITFPPFFQYWSLNHSFLLFDRSLFIF